MKTSRFKLVLSVITSLITLNLVACISTNKTKQNLVIYDFGLPVFSEHNQRSTSKIIIDKPTAADAFNHNKIRYRLMYQNPSRVFFYVESRWVTTPVELLSSKISQTVNLAKVSPNCSLKLKIEVFDHVFQTITDSEAVVQLSATIIERNTQKAIATQLFTEKVTSISPNAQGGTAALRDASEIALQKSIEWGSLVSEGSEVCK